MNNFDKDKAVVLGIGVIAIYTIYSIMGVIQQAILKVAYTNDLTGQQEHFDYPQSQLLFSALNAYIIASLYNRIKYDQQRRTCIPDFNAFKCGMAVAVSNISYSYAIELTNFPVVMMIRSCGILSVVIVGVLFTGVKDVALKLGKKKILVAVMATFGMAIFRLFDPKAQSLTSSSSLLGLGLMMLSLIADGFLPDFQAVIKSQYKPEPTVMLAYVNKWATIIAFLYAILSGNLVPMFQFLLSHNELMYDLIIFGFLATLGQFFIYRIVKEFKQHIVPFIITTRKMFTIGLSIFYYRHETSSMQVFGIILVFAVLIYEFYSEFEAGKSESGKRVGQLNSNSANDNDDRYLNENKAKDKYKHH